MIDGPKFEPNAPLVECGPKASRLMTVIDRLKFEPNAPLVECEPKALRAIIMIDSPKFEFTVLNIHSNTYTCITQRTFFTY